MAIDENLFSQNIGDLERDKFKASTDNETAVRTDGKTSLQSADGAEDVGVYVGSTRTHDSSVVALLGDVILQLKIMNNQLALITGDELEASDADI